MTKVDDDKSLKFKIIVPFTNEGIDLDYFTKRYKKDIENNKLFVCQGNDNELLFHETIFIKDLDITSSGIKDISNKNILCQVRHLGEKYKCSIDILKENLFSVKSKKLIRAPAQGQSLVIFEDNKCLGGGIITDG